jgi:hypothetical protein
MKAANKIKASRPATSKEIDEVRTHLKWMIEHDFTYSMLEKDLGKSSGWLNKVVRNTDRYTVTSIDVAVIRASYRSAFRLHGRQQRKYALMQQIIVKAGGIMRDVEELSQEV